MEFMGDNHWAALAGLFAGGALGLSSSIGRFCTLGAIEDALYGNDYSRLRMWALALAVAIASMFTLEALGQVDYSRTIYYSLKWNPIASVVGGLMSCAIVAGIFGYFVFYGRVQKWIIPILTLVFTLLLETFLGQTAGYQWRIGSVLLGGYNGMSP